MSGAAGGSDDGAELRAPPASALQMQPMQDGGGPPPRAAASNLDAALKQRPATWAVCPPDARAFAVWCATHERHTIGAALVGCREPGDDSRAGRSDVSAAASDGDDEIALR